ncbi:hypothetical protein PoB_005822400 [Plakobranchus ocellatus]|uniref:Uncharacterized protein n=1 Tax=Plakobranchus ocellatus TaxID=259542 RepID=A0AAV4CKL1_9GAST|nr:hypothetical protein PoB_005822400 [Plakobranchus ocellatus]
MVHQEHVTHIENNNGQRVKIEQKVEKVVDTDSGKVIADVKQQTQTEKSGQDAEPETVVKTKVDIPAEGVHETFVQGQQIRLPPLRNGQLLWRRTRFDMSRCRLLERRQALHLDCSQPPTFQVL